MQTSAATLRDQFAHSGMYQRLKASRFYDLYWELTDRRVLRDRDAEVDFYRSLLQGLRRGDLIFDIGANHGYKTDIFLRLGARVVAVDPDPVNQQILRQRYLSFRLRRKPVEIVGKAVSNEDAVQTLWVDHPGSAKNTLNQKWVSTLRHDTARFGAALSFDRQQQVQTVTLEHLISRHGLPFFVKIDVEGHEPNVIQGLARPVPYVSFEVNLPEFLDEGLGCVQRLSALCASAEFNFAGASLAAGLKLPHWTGAAEFCDTLNRCPEKSVEVFCRMPVAGSAYGSLGTPSSVGRSGS